MEDLEKKLFDQTWNVRNRGQIINRLKETNYDIIIIGGGITGAGIAREASMRNLKVALLDMQDFAAGTSSRSSKLAHGGIRYLGLGDMDLVKSATRERNWMREHCPTVRPIPFLFVHMKDGKYQKRDIIGAVKIYDFLSDNDSEFKNYKQYQWYKPDEIIEMEPGFIREGNLGGAVYYDNNVDDARLTIETIKEAVIRGADAINYCKVTSYLKSSGKIIGVNCIDMETGSDLEIKGSLAVNATGIWTDTMIDNYPEDIPKPLIRPTKGVHLQYRRKHVKNNMATIIRSITDDRAFFVLPRNEFTLIGTTDTDYTSDLAHPFCTKEDADYLIKSVKHYFPNAELDYKNIISTYAGIRPLVMQKGKSESEVSRNHIIFFSSDGLLTITGGKLTEWRAMAEDLFVKIEEKEVFPNIKRDPYFSRQKFIIGLDKEEWEKYLESSGLQLGEDITDHLYQQYGKGAIKILDLIKNDKSLMEKLIEENDFTKAEILYTLRYEQTPHLIDVFCRRTEMALWIDHRRASEVAEKVASIMQKEYSWDDNTKTIEINQYLEYINKTVSFIH
ncbi:MAG: glycerol-3-phosphate dehydrogenase/oxidase [Candidatus Lokiarchaeota archaeon]|nr:glycerol-3-phosphate dehydrogenase/oxidase [Candidatus Lokiarchaeota archaeon]